MPDQPDRERVKELLDNEDDILSEWECDFLDSLWKWTGDYTARQIEILERVWAKVMG